MKVEQIVTGKRLGRRRSLYKYFTERQWAEEFLNGSLLFRSLAYFRDLEDANVRGDDNEGSAVLRPEGGLIITNLTQRTTFTLPHHAFESRTHAEEIFVFCMSASLSDRLRDRFSAMVCVEIQSVKTFCERVEGTLPPTAKFPWDSNRRRIGHWVEYYRESDGVNPRWALPDKIAISKPDIYRWQDEFRLVFSLTNALEFEKVDTRLVADAAAQEPRLPEHDSYLLKVENLNDICQIREFQSS